MANDIKIRLVSETNMKGFNDAMQALKKLQGKYTTVANLSEQELKATLGSLPKFTKQFAKIFGQGTEQAKKAGGEYAKAWIQAMINSFSGGDTAKLKAEVDKVISSLMNVTGASGKNIFGEDDKAYINMTSIYDTINSVSKVMDETATDIESASRRKQVAYEREMKVLQALGLEQEQYTLTMQNAKQQMMALSPSMRNYESEMERLSKTYKEAKANLQKLTDEQAKASHSGLGGYIGTVTKGMVAHQAIASALRAVKQTLKEATQASAEAEQVLNKLNTVFDGIADSAKDMASDVASAIGVAESTAQSALSTVGDLLQGQGMGVSESLQVAYDWVKRFQDIINFKDINEDLGTFASNMMAGFLGNTRNLRTVGVIIKDSAVNAELAKRNMDKLTGSERELAKMNIRAEMTFKQLDNAIGATEREWDTNLAVNRRLNEAWKEYKENLGDTINSVLKPMKMWWTDILTQINKANKAQKEYEQGNRDIHVYDIQNNEKDLKSFEASTIASVSQMVGYMDTGAESGNGQLSSYIKEQLDELNVQMILYGATVLDVAKIFKENLTPTMYEYLHALEDERIAENKRLKDIKERTTNLITASENFAKFQESLLGITGVNFQVSDFSGIASRASGSDGAMQYALGLMANWTATNIDNAIQSIADADLSLWGDVISGELEGLEIPELFEKKMESVAQLFSAVWNEALKDGVMDDEEEAKLERIKKLYADLGAELDAYTTELERQKNVTSALESMESGRKGYETQVAQIGMDSADKSMDDLNREFSATMETLGYVGKEWEAFIADYEENSDKWTEEERKNAEERIAEYNRLNSAHSRQVYWLDKLNKANAEYERKEKAKTAIQERANAILDIENQIRQIGMDDNAKAMDDLRIAYEEQIASLNLTDKELEDLTEQYDRQKDALQKLHTATKVYNDQLEAQERREGIKGQYDYVTQLANFGKTDAEIQREEMVALRDELASKHDPLWVEIQKQIDAFDDLQKATKELEESQKSFSDKVTEGIFGKYSDTGFAKSIGGSIANSTGGQIVQAGIEGGATGGPWGAILGVLMAILSKTESFQEILNMIEPVIEMFDTLIKPLVPAIQAITDTLNTLVLAMIRPLLPVVKLIAEVIVLISTPIKMIHAIIDNIYIAVHNIWQRILHPLTGGDQQAYNNLADIIDESAEQLEQIKNITFDIKKNTDANNSELLKAYQQMRDNQMITASEFDALVANLKGVKYDRVNSVNGTSWQNGSGNTTIVYNGDMRFVIDGTNLDYERIASAVMRKMQQMSATGQYAY